MPKSSYGGYSTGLYKSQRTSSFVPVKGCVSKRMWSHNNFPLNFNSINEESTYWDKMSSGERHWKKTHVGEFSGQDWKVISF